MKSTFVLSALALVFAFATQAQASTILKVRGARATALFNALGGDASTPTSDEHGIIRVNNVECSVQTETQRGDPDDPTDGQMTFTMCTVADARQPLEDAGEYLGLEALSLVDALKAAGVRPQGPAKSARLNARAIKCSSKKCVIRTH